MSSRIESVRHLLQTENLDALILFGLADMRYLCGFTGSDGVLFICADAVIFLSDSRYQQQAHREVSADQIQCYSNKLQALADLVASRSLHRVGLDGRKVTIAQYRELEHKTVPLGVELCPLMAQLEGLRSVKDADELKSMQAAADLNRQAFERVLPLIRPGVSERDIALELEIQLKKHGGEANSFDFIVASGVRGALPHGVASRKSIAAGELVTIDFGTHFDGYCSDETVTLAVGKVNGKLRQMFDIVLEAHDRALAAARSGIRACDLDVIAREYITENGYGDYFGHGLGHGVGLEVHEFPTLNGKNEVLLKPGMVVTIEPGIYLPDVGGVRIEDTVVITDRGCRRLTTIPKDYRELVLY